MNDPIGKQNSYYVIWHENIVVSFFLQRMPYSSMNPIEGRFSSGASRVLRPVPSYSETEVAATKDRGWTYGLWASRAGYASWTCGPGILRKLWWLYNFMMPFRTRFVISYKILANLGFIPTKFDLGELHIFSLTNSFIISFFELFDCWFLSVKSYANNILLIWIWF